MGDIWVTYNGQQIYPTPLVNRNYQFIDYGGRWGNVLQIELNGLLTGLSSTGDVSTITNFFTGQFGDLVVSETGNPLYTWHNCVVEEISFAPNVFFQQSHAPYSVKLRSYNVPSGVIEPVNEYGFTQSDDGIVTVNHKISAKGVKNANGALNNAISFVQTFTGRNPFAPVLMPSGQSVMISRTDLTDREAGAYSVTEIFKYNTGSTNPYLVEDFTVSVSDSSTEEFLTMDTSLRFRGSPVEQTLAQVEASVNALDILSRINAVFGYDTSRMMRNNFSVTRDSGACIIDIHGSFLSGYNTSDLQGYLDYNITLDDDVITPKQSWKVEGEFFCKGPLAYRQQQLSSFTAANSSNWESYMLGLLTASDLYVAYQNGSNLSSHPTLNINENTGLATFRISMTVTDGYQPNETVNPKYSFDFEPSKWTFDLLPAANIEGHYVVQDLQMTTQSKINFNLSCESQTPTTAIPTLSGWIDDLQTLYIANGNSNNENITSGLLDVSYNKAWIGQDTTISTGLLYTKVVGSKTSNFVRQPGFLFGY